MFGVNSYLLRRIMIMSSWFVYIIECRDKSYYTGITTDLDRRVFEHNNKIGAKSIRGKLPVKLVFSEPASSQTDAAKREKAIKGWSHLKKKELVDLGVYPEERSDEGV